MNQYDVPAKSDLLDVLFGEIANKFLFLTASEITLDYETILRTSPLPPLQEESMKNKHKFRDFNFIITPEYKS